MIEIVDPRGSADVARGVLAPRRGSLAGVRRIGFLSNEAEHNTGPHFPGYTKVLEAAFRDRLGDLTVRRQVKPVLSRPAEPDMLAQFLDFDGVVNGLAK